MSQANLAAMYVNADADDRAEGRLAYPRYAIVMRRFSETYDVPLDRTVAAFVALSPNNDYFGNLRSLASVLAYHATEHQDAITISTYNHCKTRALAYVRGEAKFLETVKGPKVRSFYQNILDPGDPHPVTIDGHIKAAWKAERLTMRNAIVKGRREYTAIADDVRDLAAEHGLLANQMQATIWFARKRAFGIVYKPQLDLFAERSDKWQTLVAPRDAPPYKLRTREG